MKRNRYPDITNEFGPRADNARRKRQESIATFIVASFCGAVLLWKVFEFFLNGGK